MAIDFYRSLVEYVRFLERSNDPTLPYDVAREFSKHFQVEARTQADVLNRYLGKFLEADHLVEKRFSGHLPSANLDPSMWDSKVVPKNAKTASQLNKFRTKPFPYVHQVKTAMMKKLIPHSLEGSFTPQEIWDAHAWVFKQLGIEDELDRLKDYFRNAGVRFRIPKRNPLTRASWKKKASFRVVSQKGSKRNKSDKAKLRENRKQRNLERARQRQARKRAQERKAMVPEGATSRATSESSRGTSRENRGTADSTSATPAPSSKATSKRSTGRVSTFVISAKHKITGTIKFISLKNILKLGSPLAFDMLLDVIGGAIRAQLQERALAILFRDFLDDKKVQEEMDAEIGKNPRLENDQVTAWYLHLIVTQRWMGMYDEDGDTEISNGEVLEKIQFESVEVLADQGRRKCKTIGFRAIPNSRPGMNWRYERCTYPFLINPIYKHKEAAEAFSRAFEECVQNKLGRKPAGPTTPQEEEFAREACASELGGIPIPFEPGQIDD